MNYLKDAVYEKPTFEKKAEVELPKDISDWNEDILKNFFTELPFIPRDAGVDVVINNVDENKGYAKGSVVVFYKTRKINFPIIVKDFQMFPFDVFVADLNGKQTFFNASEKNVKSYLMTNEIGEIKNMYDYAYSQNLKTPGGVAPKPSVPLDQAYHDFVVQDQAMMNMRKMSSLKNATVEDLEKLAIQLQAQPNVRESFNETTGDLHQQVVDLIKEKRNIMKEKTEGKLDLNHVLQAKQTLVALDSEMFDVNNLKPIQAPACAEIRLYEYPTMDDFMQSGQSAVSRLKASKVGNSMSGVLVTIKNLRDNDSMGPCMAQSSDDKNKREPIPQIFISSCGKYYKKRYDYNKSGVLFYGSEIKNAPGLMESIIKNLQKDSVDFYRFDQSNHNDGADRVFNPIWQTNEGKRCDMYGENRERRYAHTIGNPERHGYDKGVFILYGAGSAWECVEFPEVQKTWVVDGKKIFIGKGAAIVPANVLSVQKVGGVDVMTQPAYKIALGHIKDIYLVPENFIYLNRSLMSELDDEDIMEPNRPIKEKWEKQNITKVSVWLGSEGYNIKGQPIEPLMKVAGMSGELDTATAMASLKIMGVDDVRSKEILKTAMDRGVVTVYGVRNDYLNPNAFKDMEKGAKAKDIMKKIASELKVNLVKEASVIEDEEAVDTVLSLNFINEDNLQDYIDNMASMKKIVTKLASMLVASRMGLSDIDEGAAKKAIDGLEKVIDGLESVKLALGK